jgi:hypothetical protein
MIFARTGLLLALSAGLLATASPRVHAQGLTHGTVSGRVESADGVALRNASVFLVHARGGMQRDAETTLDGRFAFGLLAPGTYEVRVEQLGYAPLVARAITVLAGRDTRLRLQLNAAAPPVVRVDTVFGAGTAGPPAPSGAAVTATRLDLLPLVSTAGATRLWSVAAADLGSEGLPGSMSELHLDGVRRAVAGHPVTGTGSARALGLPLAGLEVLQFATDAPDTELRGTPGGHLLARSTPGLSRPGGDVQFATSSGSLASSPDFDAAEPGGSSLRSRAFFSGPIAGDSVHISTGVHWLRHDVPIGRLPRDATALAAVRELAQARGTTLDVPAYQLAATEVQAGFARVDWRAADRAVAFARADASRVREPVAGPAGQPLPFGPRVQTDAMGAAAGVILALGTGWHAETRLGLTVSSAGEPDNDIGGAVVATRFADYGVWAGASAMPLEADLRAFDLSQSFTRMLDRHQLKGGFDIRVDAHTWKGTQHAGGFLAGAAEDVLAGDAVFRQVSGLTESASFTALGFGTFLQDVVRMGSGFELLAGARVDVVRRPADELTANEEWLRLTGIATDSVVRDEVQFSPRIILNWDAGGSTAATAGFTVAHGAADAAILGEAVTRQGSVRVRTSVDAGETWPAAPSAVTELGPTLSFLTPRYRAPRTARFAAALRQALPVGTLQVGGVFRRTEFLPRRTDLNLATAPATDQHGRPVFGELVQRGTSLVAAPGSNRRFPEFDAVYAINADGTSEHHGITVALDSRLLPAVEIAASYTYSRTRDDWPLLFGSVANPGLAPLSAGADTMARQWGISDLDVPHRLGLGATAVARAGSISLSLGAVLAVRSGAPFTPGMAPGIDANADGVFGSDVAFIDPAIPGMGELLAQWPCLSEATGRFAVRNACRAGQVRSLDTRLGIGLPAFGGVGAELIVELFDLFSAGSDLVDTALLLLPRDASIERSNGQVTVPYFANPDFGRPLINRPIARTLHIGARVTF